MAASSCYDLNVFINCPFDRRYLKLFHAVIFVVHDCGFVARCALEITDTSQVRITKILKIISGCRIGIHDLSRTEVSGKPRLPRFNMPLELGMFLGAKAYGDAAQKRKIGLVLDREEHRYQKFCSDISGQDISAHHGETAKAMKAVRNFLASTQRNKIMPGPTKIHQRFEAFMKELPSARRKLGLTKTEVGFIEYTNLVAGWLQVHPRP